jgi:hypothetical protein
MTLPVIRPMKANTSMVLISHLKRIWWGISSFSSKFSNELVLSSHAHFKLMKLNVNSWMKKPKHDCVSMAQRWLGRLGCGWRLRGFQTESLPARSKGMTLCAYIEYCCSWKYGQGRSSADLAGVLIRFSDEHWNLLIDVGWKSHVGSDKNHSINLGGCHQQSPWQYVLIFLRRKVPGQTRARTRDLRQHRLALNINALSTFVW